MATTKKATSSDAPAQGAAAAPAPAPAAGQQGQEPNADQAQPAEGGPDGEPAPDYKALYEEAVGQRDEYAEQLTKTGEELLRTIGERDTAHDTVPLFDDPYSALGEKEFETVLEIVLGEARSRDILTTPEDSNTDEPEPAASTEPAAEAEPDPNAEARDAMRRHGLATAWLVNGQWCFSEKHAREWAGTEQAFAELETLTAG